MKKLIPSFIAGACLLLSHSSLSAQAGALDLSFSGDGKVITDFYGEPDGGHAVAIQPDGKILAGGAATQNNISLFALARYNDDGSLDTSFGSGGHIETEFQGASASALAIALQPDGKIILAGTVGPNAWDIAMARYNPDGSLDSAFGLNGKVISALTPDMDIVGGITLQADGKILVAGGTRILSEYQMFVARFDTNGSPDTAFGINGFVITDIGTNSEFAYSVVVQPDSHIVIGGNAYGADPDFALVRYNPDGSFDTTFGSGGIAVTPIGNTGENIYSIALQPDGKIVAAGSAYVGNFSAFALARYNTDGTFDTAFANNGKVIFPVGASYAEPLSLLIEPNGKLIATGYSYNGSDYEFTLMRLNADGTADQSFGIAGFVFTNFSSLTDLAFSAALDHNNRVVVCGNANSDYALARYLLCGTTTSTTSITSCGSVTSPSGNYTWTTSGTYMDTLVNTNGCDSVLTVNVVINTVDISVAVANATLTSNAPGAAYQWVDCNNNYAPIAGETSQSFTALVSGSYALIITESSCTDTSACYAVVVTGVTENVSGQPFTLYPNPARDAVTIESAMPLQDAGVKIISLTGQVVLAQDNLSGMRVTINIASLPAGVYFAELSGSGNISRQRFVKE
jgi:uncharacterized delta-60 repeat protein